MLRSRGANGRQRLSRAGNRAGPYYRQPDKPVPSNPKRSSRPLTVTVKRFVAWVLTRTGIVIAVVAFVFWGLTSTQDPKVIVGSGTQYRSVAVYVDAAKSKMHSARDLTKFTFDTSAVEQYLKSQFPEIASVSVELPLIGRQPVVRISIAKPALYLVTKSELDVVSSEGKVIGSAKDLHLSKPMPRLLANGTTGIGGDQILGAEQVTFIENIQGQLSYAKVAVDHYQMSTTAQELDLYLKGKSYYVKFNFAGDGVGQAGSYLATDHYLKLHHITPSQYVDVRVPGKVFYK